MSISGNPEIRVERRPDGFLVGRVLYVREGHEDVDLTALFSVTEIRRVITVEGLPKTELQVIARLVEIEDES